MKKKASNSQSAGFARVRRKDFKIEGEKVYLRPVVPADATQAYCRWLNDPMINRYTEARFRRTTVKDLKKYVRDVLANPADLFFAIVEKESDRHIGNLKIHSIFGPPWYHGVGDIGLIIGEQGCHGKGYGTDAIILACKVAFGRLGLHKLCASCYSRNIGSAKAFLKAGFRKEGVRPRHVHSEGKQVDLILLGAINPRFAKRS